MNTLKEKSYQTLELLGVLELLAAQTQTARGREAALEALDRVRTFLKEERL